MHASSRYDKRSIWTLFNIGGISFILAITRWNFSWSTQCHKSVLHWYAKGWNRKCTCKRSKHHRIIRSNPFPMKFLLKNKWLRGIWHFYRIQKDQTHTHGVEQILKKLNFLANQLAISRIINVTNITIIANKLATFDTLGDMNESNVSIAAFE